VTALVQVWTPQDFRETVAAAQRQVPVALAAVETIEDER
jgi:hypothetical protein